MSVSPAVQLPASAGIAHTAQHHVLRFRPGADVLLSLQHYVDTHAIQAASIVSAVGSLTQLSLRLANASETTSWPSPSSSSSSPLAKMGDTDDNKNNNATEESNIASNNANKKRRTFEIVSLSGTLSCHKSHVHMSAADGAGAVIGGHLVPGSLVYTTLEVVIAVFPELVLSVAPDLSVAEGGSGYSELVVSTIVGDGAASPIDNGRGIAIAATEAQARVAVGSGCCGVGGESN